MKKIVKVLFIMVGLVLSMGVQAKTVDDYYNFYSIVDENNTSTMSDRMSAIVKQVLNQRYEDEMQEIYIANLERQIIIEDPVITQDQIELIYNEDIDDLSAVTLSIFNAIHLIDNNKFDFQFDNSVSDTIDAVAIVEFDDEYAKYGSGYHISDIPYMCRNKIAGWLSHVDMYVLDCAEAYAYEQSNKASVYTIIEGMKNVSTENIWGMIFKDDEGKNCFGIVYNYYPETDEFDVLSGDITRRMPADWVAKKAELGYNDNIVVFERRD